MSTVTTKQPKKDFGVRFPKAVIEELDKRKGRYMSRTGFLLMIVDQYLLKEKNAQ